MARRGYDRRFVYGLRDAGGTSGILIPPSIPMTVFGFVVEDSVAAIFLAGTGPGLLPVSFFVIFSMLHARFSDDYMPIPKAGWAVRRESTVRALPSLALAGLIVAGHYSGGIHACRSIRGWVRSRTCNCGRASSHSWLEGPVGSGPRQRADDHDYPPDCRWYQGVQEGHRV